MPVSYNGMTSACHNISRAGRHSNEVSFTVAKLSSLSAERMVGFHLFSVSFGSDWFRMVWGFVAALLAFFQGGAEICGGLEKTMRRRQALLDSMNKRYEQENALWAYVRSRLEV